MLAYIFLLSSWFWLHTPSKAAYYLPEKTGTHSKASSSLQWLTLEQALEKNKKHPKKILIDVYTDWCGWCKRMDKQVYKDPAVVALLNRDFYVVKFNAEQKNSVTIQGTVFKYEEKYKAHALALSLLQGQMSYPSTVFLNEKEQVMQRVPGYFPAKDFLKVLDYITTR